MHRTITGLLTLALATSVTAACSIKKMAINGLADTLAASGDGFSSDEDPDLIRDAILLAQDDSSPSSSKCPSTRACC